MGKVIPMNIPELSESQARRILDNVSNAVCQPIPKAQAIMEEINYISYKFQRNAGMSAEDLHVINFPNSWGYEVEHLKELEERLEATGGKDE